MSVITVTSSKDSGAGSLRAAIASAGSGDTIDFASGVTSIALNTPLVIGQNVDIDADYLHDNHSVAISGEVVVQQGSTVTLDHMHVSAASAGANAASNAEDGADGANGTPGQDGTTPGQPGTNGGDGENGGNATSSSGVATSGGPALENDGNLTLIQSSVVGTATGGKGAGGAQGGQAGDGGAGGSGANGVTSGGAPGGKGGNAGDSGAGSSGTDGGDAVGGIINTGTLTLQDSTVTGSATGGDGGDGGYGGGFANTDYGGRGGHGGVGGATLGPQNSSGYDGGAGGSGGNSGDGGDGGDGGKGGSAVGGIVNTGTVKIVGGAVLGGDSATAGAGGAAGPGGFGGGDPNNAGLGGGGGIAYGSGTPGNYGPNGMDGMAGVNGGNGIGGDTGTATVDYLDKGSTTGTFTINGRIFDLDPDLSGQAAAVNISGSTPTKFTYDARSLFGSVAPGASVGWKIVSGANGPLAGDFVGPTSGVLSYASATAAGTSDDMFSVQLNADSAAPRNESFTVELIDPSTGNVIGSVGSLTQNVTNLAAPLCFVSGTLIATARGNVPVEDLRIGDLAVTVSGTQRPIRWIGHRALDGRHLRSRDAHPIRIAARAFGDMRPARDLWLSPGHPVLIGADDDGTGGHLVPIMCLVNGTSIERDFVDEVTYWHVELDAHDVLIAEGLPAESYIDLGSRPWFEGADGVLTDPDLVLAGGPGRCRPVATDGPVIESERRRLDGVFAMRLHAACAWLSAEDHLSTFD